MTQAEVLKLIDWAQSQAEIETAFAAADEWLKKYPNDKSVRASLEGLVMLEQAIQLEG